MNTDTGEIRKWSEELAQKVADGEPWVPITEAQVERLAPLPPADRPAALRKWDAKKAKAQERRNRKTKGKRS